MNGTSDCQVERTTPAVVAKTWKVAEFLIMTNEIAFGSGRICDPVIGWVGSHENKRDNGSQYAYGNGEIVHDGR